jgi:hypothetical protein
VKYWIHIRPDAEMEIEEAARWYEMQRKCLGDEFLDEVLWALEIISEQ